MSKILHPVESTRASGIISLKVLKTRLVEFLLLTYEPCLTIFDQFVHCIVLLQSLTFIFCRRRKGNKKSKSRLSSNDEGENGYELSIKNEAFVGEDFVDAVQILPVFSDHIFLLDRTIFDYYCCLILMRVLPCVVTWQHPALDQPCFPKDYL